MAEKKDKKSTRTLNVQNDADILIENDEKESVKTSVENVALEAKTVEKSATDAATPENSDLKNLENTNAMEEKKRIKLLGKQKRKNLFGIFKRVLKLMAGYKWGYVAVMLLYVINVGANVAGTALLTLAIDNYIAPLANPAMNVNGVVYADFIKIICVMASVYAVGALSTYGADRICVLVSSKILQKVRDDMFEHMQKLPIRYFDTHAHGDIMSCYTNDTDTLRELLANALPTMVSSVLTIVTIFIVMLVLNPILTLTIVVMIFIMVLIVGKVGGKSGKFFMAQQKAIGITNGFIEEHIEGQKVVKVFNHEEYEKSDFDKVNGMLCKAAANANTYANILMPILGNLTYINFALTAVLGAIFAVAGIGGMTFGKMAAFLLYSRQFGNPISQMAQQANTVLMSLAGASRIFELLDQQAEQDEGYVKLVNVVENPDGTLTECDERTGVWAWKHPHKELGTTTLEKLNGEVQFDDVTFGYVPEKTVLKDIDFFAHDGQKVALVGSTGAGKTTITNLINRFYDVPDGKIRYDGININKIKKDDLRHSLSMVLQDTHLFTGTVMDNIRYGKLDATDEEVIEASRLANADFFITHLPDGYNTMLTADGGNLSQGQRQLLSIARALIANPPVLILDEATSSIDMRTEKHIEQGLNNLMQGRTVFIIAHRLSTVRNADMILVLEHGEIIERGNHEQLIALKGKYYQLYTGAFELD